jgi:hypothetical protein
MVLTSITSKDVSKAEPFLTVGDAFIRFMQEHADEYSTTHGKVIEHIILVGHNGQVFDILFFVYKLCVHHIIDRFLQDDRFGLGIETL